MSTLEDYVRQSKSTVRILLEQLMEQKIIERIGKGRATHYRNI